MEKVEIEIKAGEKEDGMDEWKVECAYNDLMRAEEIKADPELMAEIAKLIKKKLPGKIKSLKELRKIAKMRIKELDESKESESEESEE